MIDNAIYRGCVTAAKIGLLIPILVVVLLLIIITFIIVVVITIAHYMITYLQEG